MLTEGHRLKTFFLFISIVIISSLLLSCNSGDNRGDNDIDGLWNIVAAKRNAKETTTMRDGFFQFDKDSTMSTNIFGAIQSYSYLRKGDVIQQSGDQQVEYQISFKSEDTLNLSAIIYSYEFDFIAVRDTAMTPDSLVSTGAE